MGAGSAWRKSWLPALIAAAGAATLQTACTSANPVLTFFFDGVPPAGEKRPPSPVVHQPRRPTYVPPPPAIKMVEVPDLPPPIDWNARYQALPRNEAGEVAWVRALDEKVLSPKPAISGDAKEDDPTDLDLEYVPKGQPEYKVVFPHKPHTQWLGCANCHTGIFEMEKGKAAMTMAKLEAGAYCGVCHGKVASPDLSACAGCHPAFGK